MSFTGFPGDIYFTWQISQFEPSVVRFLAFVEPSIDGLGRLTMAFERIEQYYIKRGPGRFQEEMPITLLELWADRLGESALVDKPTVTQDPGEMNLDELLNPESLVASGLESWADPSDMVSFIFWLRHDWSRESFTDVARALSRNWQDRRKADAFIAGVERKVQGWASHNLAEEIFHGDY